MPTDALRLLAVGSIIAVLAAVIAVMTPAPAAHADYCELIGCWRECRPVPGGVWCQRRCRRRCWRAPEPQDDPPAYDPEPAPQYRSRSYAPVPRGAINLEPVLVLLGAFGLIAALFVAAVAAAIQDSATEELITETEETERQTAEARMLIAEAEAKAREIDAHIDRFLSDTRR